MSTESFVTVFQWVSISSAALAVLSTVAPWASKRSDRIARLFCGRPEHSRDFELIAVISTVLALISSIGLWIFTEHIDNEKNGRIVDLKSQVATQDAIITNLRDKTAGLTTLPDGRVMSGGLLSGRAALLIDRLDKLWPLYEAGKNQEAYDLALDCIQRYEQSEVVQPMVRMGDVCLSRLGVSSMYAVAAHVAQKLNHRDAALRWARKAVAADAIPFSTAVLTAELINARQLNEARDLAEKFLAKGGPDADEFKLYFPANALNQLSTR